MPATVGGPQWKTVDSSGTDYIGCGIVTQFSTRIKCFLLHVDMPSGPMIVEVWIGWVRCKAETRPGTHTQCSREWPPLAHVLLPGTHTVTHNVSTWHIHGMVGLVLSSA